jgi:hypothetical protein
MHRRTGLLILVASLLFLASLACGGPTEPTNPPQPPPPTEVLIVVEPTMPPEPTLAPEPTEAPPLPVDYTCECDPRAEPIDINTTIPLNMHTATGGYPANCQYWCACVPGGGSALDIGITDFTVDLDMYVAWNDFEGITGETPVYGESYTWMSNAYGTGDEWVDVTNPVEGPYYIEVCSYEGDPSPYNLVTELR